MRFGINEEVVTEDDQTSSSGTIDAGAGIAQILNRYRELQLNANAELRLGEYARSVRASADHTADAIIQGRAIHTAILDDPETRYDFRTVDICFSPARPYRSRIAITNGQISRDTMEQAVARITNSIRDEIAERIDDQVREAGVEIIERDDTFINAWRTW